MKYNTPSLLLLTAFSILFASCLLFSSCEKSSLDRNNPLDENGVTTGTGFPVLTDGSIEDVYANGAIFIGEVTSQGAGEVYEKGVCYNFSGNPSLSYMKIAAAGGTGNYQCEFSGLLPGYTYYLRAYATNANGTAYGHELSFTTPY